jgi:hypothetical protein
MKKYVLLYKKQKRHQNQILWKNNVASRMNTGEYHLICYQNKKGSPAINQMDKEVY